MASWVEIANLALRKMGQDRIASLDDENEAARAVKDVHLLARDIVLRKHPWNCALALKVLAPDAAAPPFGFTYAYSFPTSPFCLRVWRLDADEHPRAKWKARGRKIHTDEGPALYVEFISRLDDPEQFDANLAEAVAAEIAAKTAFRITASRTAEKEMNDWARETIPEARSYDAQEGVPDDPDDGDFLMSRH